MNREALTDKEIVQFLEYYNQPDRFGLYHKIQEGQYPVYKLNLEEHQLWMMVADFFSTYRIGNIGFSHDTAFFRTAIKRGWLDGVKQLLRGKNAPDQNMTVTFLTQTARRGVWDEGNNSTETLSIGRGGLA